MLDLFGIIFYNHGTMRREKRYTISLFSGAMGLDLGLERAGFETRVAVETEKAAVLTVEKNRPKISVINKPIQNVSTSDILEKARLSAGEATIVTGGPCCQSFSTAGKRGSLCDSRGTLFKDFCRVISETKPRFFVMENVKGLLSAAVRHRPLKERGPGFPPLAPEEELGSAFKVITKELASLDYYIIYGLVNSADYGTPQVRHRVLIIGSRDGEDITLPRPTHSKDGKDGKLKWVTLKKALSRVNPKEWVSFSDRTREVMESIRPGEDWTALPQDIQKEALGAAYHSWGGRKGFYRRLSWDRPAPSLTTAPDGRATMLCHPKEDRPLSVEEYARIQEFPDGYTFEGSLRKKYVMIGNAVPVSLGEAVGRALRKTMKKTAAKGLSEDAQDRKGVVKCVDPVLEERLKNRPKTQLNPPRMRQDPDPKAARKWLAQKGESIPS